MRRAKTWLAVIGLNLLFVLALEGAARGWYAWKDAREAAQPDPRALLPAYADAGYDPVETWRELLAATDRWLRYEPYTVWSRTDAGALVSVDAERHRTTRHNSDEREALEIWAFGGSTMWGMGVPDAETLPSHLARELNAWGAPTRVRNLGETGFVATQELIQLVRELQSGARPDVVLVYHGGNQGLGLAEDVASLDPHYLLNRIRDLFEGRDPDGRRSFAGALRETGLARVARALRRRIAPEDPRAALPPAPTADAEIPALAERSADALLETYAMTEAFGAVYGFRPFFFFQPTPDVGAKPRDASEEEIVARLRSEPKERWIFDYTRALRDALRARVREGRAPASFRDLSDVFAEVPEALYIDWIHLTHRGNRILAAHLAGLLRDELCRTPPRLPGRRALAERLAAACAGNAAGAAGT